MLFDPDVGGLPLLFIRRSMVVSTHQGQIAFPGGRVEDDDAGPAATALREAREELDIEPDAVEVIGTLPPITTATTGRWLDPVVALRRGPLHLHPDGHEVAEHFWLLMSDLLAAPITRRPISGAAGRRDVIFIEIGGRVVWGATGAIVDELVRRLRAAN